VGCGRIAPKSELLRLAVAGPTGDRRVRRAVIDERGSMPGRGAYLCRGAECTSPEPDCLQEALRRGGIARTLRGAVKLDIGDLSRAIPNS
jgi:predicted RNA-binding protein YlxR (DUF448 family)